MQARGTPATPHCTTPSKGVVPGFRIREPSWSLFKFVKIFGARLLSYATGSQLATCRLISRKVPKIRLRFGMIGIGMQGNWLLGSAIDLPGVECVRVCDLYESLGDTGRADAKSGSGSSQMVFAVRAAPAEAAPIPRN